MNKEFLEALWKASGGKDVGSFDAFVNELKTKKEFQTALWNFAGGKKIGSEQQFLDELGIFKETPAVSTPTQPAVVADTTDTKPIAPAATTTTKAQTTPVMAGPIAQPEQSVPMFSTTFGATGATTSFAPSKAATPSGIKVPVSTNPQERYAAYEKLRKAAPSTSTPQIKQITPAQESTFVQKPVPITDIIENAVKSAEEDKTYIKPVDKEFGDFIPQDLTKSTITVDSNGDIVGVPMFETDINRVGTATTFTPQAPQARPKVTQVDISDPEVQKKRDAFNNYVRINQDLFNGHEQRLEQSFGTNFKKDVSNAFNKHSDLTEEITDLEGKIKSKYGTDANTNPIKQEISESAKQRAALSDRLVEIKAKADQIGERKKRLQQEFSDRENGVFTNATAYAEKIDESVSRMKEIDARLEEINQQIQDEQISETDIKFTPLKTEWDLLTTEKTTLYQDAVKFEGLLNAENAKIGENSPAFAELQKEFDLLTKEEEALVQESSNVANTYNDLLGKEQSAIQQFKDNLNATYEADPLVKQYNNAISRYQDNWKTIDKFQSHPSFPKYFEAAEELEKLGEVRKVLFKDVVDAETKAKELTKAADALARQDITLYTPFAELPFIKDIVQSVKSIFVDTPAVGTVSILTNKLKSASYNYAADVLATVASFSDLLNEISPVDISGVGRQLRVGDLFGANITALKNAENITSGAVRSDVGRGSFLESRYKVTANDKQLLSLGFKPGDSIVVEDGKAIMFRDSDDFVKETLLDANGYKKLNDYINKNKDKVESEFELARGITSSLPSMIDLAFLVTGTGAGAKALTKLTPRLSKQAASNISTFGVSTLQQYGDVYKSYLDKGVSPGDAALYATGQAAGVSLLELLNPLESKLLALNKASTIAKWRKVRDTTLDLFSRGKIGTKDMLMANTKALVTFLKEEGIEIAEEDLQGWYETEFENQVLGQKKTRSSEERWNTALSTFVVAGAPSVMQGRAAYNEAKSDVLTTAYYMAAKDMNNLGKDLADLMVDEKLTAQEIANTYSVINYIKDELDQYDNLTDNQGAGVTGLILTRLGLENKLKATQNDEAKKAIKEKIDKVNIQIKEVVDGKVEPATQPQVAEVLGEDLEEKRKGFVTKNEFDKIAQAGKLPQGMTFEQFQELNIEDQRKFRDAAMGANKQAIANKKAYDFDDTLFDNKTGKLTVLGEEVKKRIEAGEDVTIVTARTPEQTQQIKDVLGIAEDKIEATGDEKLKKEALDKRGIDTKDYYDVDTKKMEAVQEVALSSAPDAGAAKLAGELQTSIERADEIEKIDKRAQRVQAILDNDAALVEEGEESLLGEEKKKALQDELANLKTRKDAIQKQSTTAVPVQPGAQTSPGVGGQVQAKPEGPAGKGKVQGKAEAETEIKEIDSFIANQVVNTEVSLALGDVDKRMNDAEYIQESELNKRADDLYKIWDSVDRNKNLTEDQKESLKSKLETQIQKLEQYELATATKVGKTVERKTIKGPRVIGRTARKIPSKYEVTPQRIAEQKTTTVTDKDGNTFEGKWEVLPNGNLQVVNPQGRVVPITEGYSFKETIKDDKGNVTGAILEDIGTGTTFTVDNPDLALDMAIKAKEMALGPIEDGIFEQVYQEVITKTEPILTREIKATTKGKEATPTPAAGTKIEPTTKTALEQIGKTKKQIVDQIYKFFTSKIPGLSEVQAKEFAEVNYNMWKAVADTLGGNKGLEYIRQKVSLIGTISTEKEARDFAKAEKGDIKFQKEVEDIIAASKKDGTYMKAPNGKDTNLNENQWATVRTKAFKDWFGDWENDPDNSSKIVDENGEPQVMYTGTSKDKDFDKFNVPKNGTWFTTDPKEASMYAEQNDSQSTSYDFITGKYIDKNVAARVIPVFLNIRRPEFFNESIPEKDREQLRYASNYKKLQATYFQNIYFKKPIGQRTDGLYYTDNKKVVVVLEDPNQIKSAIGNSGAFSTTNARIQFQAGETQQAAPEQLQEVAERIVNNAIDHLQDIVKRDTAALKKESNPARRKEIQQSIKTNQDTISKLQKARKDPRFQADVYHGSPYIFDKFSLDNIGTGEGAQAFGWGLYFTELKNIAEWYANILTDAKQLKFESSANLSENELSAINSFIETGVDDIAKLIKLIQDLPTIGYQGQNWAAARSAIKKITANNSKIIKPSKSIYKVSLHKGKTPDQYTWLEWDKPISEKTKKIINDKLYSNKDYEIKELNNKYYVLKEGESITSGYNTKEKAVEFIDLEINRGRTKINNSNNGADVYENISKALGGDKQASLFLLENGIDGIKYPAESIARGATSDTARGFNYVVFDENAVTIEERIQFQQEAAQFRGATIALANGSSVVASLSSPSPTTLPHEGIFHAIIEDAMTPEEQTAFIEEYNREFGDNATEWNTDVSEYTARTYEKYLSNGRKLTAAEVPNAKRRNILQQAFDKFTELVKEFYNGIIEYNNSKGVTKQIEVSPQAQAFFDRVTGIVTPSQAQAAPQVTETTTQAEQKAAEQAEAEAEQQAAEKKMEPKDPVQKLAQELVLNPESASEVSEQDAVSILNYLESLGLNVGEVKRKCK